MLKKFTGMQKIYIGVANHHFWFFGHFWTIGITVYMYSFLPLSTAIKQNGLVFVLKSHSYQKVYICKLLKIESQFHKVSMLTWLSDKKNWNVKMIFMFDKNFTKTLTLLCTIMGTCVKRFCPLSHDSRNQGHLY